MSSSGTPGSSATHGTPGGTQAPSGATPGTGTAHGTPGHPGTPAAPQVYYLPVMTIEEITEKALKFREQMSMAIRDPVLLDQVVSTWVQQQIVQVPQGTAASSTAPLLAVETECEATTVKKESLGQSKIPAPWATSSPAPMASSTSPAPMASSTSPAPMTSSTSTAPMASSTSSAPLAPAASAAASGIPARSRTPAPAAPKPRAPTLFGDEATQDKGYFKGDQLAKGKGKRPHAYEEPKGKGKKGRLDSEAAETIDLNKDFVVDVGRHLGRQVGTCIEDYIMDWVPDFEDQFDYYMACLRVPMAEGDIARIRDEWHHCILRSLLALREGIFKDHVFRRYFGVFTISHSGHLLHPTRMWVLWHRGGSPKPTNPCKLPQLMARGLSHDAQPRPRNRDEEEVPMDRHRRGRDPNRVWPPTHLRIPEALWQERGSVHRDQCYICKGVNHHGYNCPFLWAWYHSMEGTNSLRDQGIEYPEEVRDATMELWRIMAVGLELHYPLALVCVLSRRIHDGILDEDHFESHGDYLEREELAARLGYPRGWEEMTFRELEGLVIARQRRAVQESQGLGGGTSSTGTQEHSPRFGTGTTAIPKQRARTPRARTPRGRTPAGIRGPHTLGTPGVIETGTLGGDGGTFEGGRAWMKPTTQGTSEDTGTHGLPAEGTAGDDGGTTETTPAVREPSVESVKSELDDATY